MTPDIAQKLVHELPGWDRSVTDARDELGYDPALLTPDAIDWDGLLLPGSPATDGISKGGVRPHSLV
jgi:hypothetical protein